MLFIMMLLFPLAASSLSAHKNKRSDDALLYIRQDVERDPRYFSRSFTLLFRKALATYNGDGTIVLSKKEHIIDADKAALPTLCKDIVYAQHNVFQPEAGTIFEKEIYAAQDALLIGIKTVRAVYSEKNLVIGEGTAIERWADAENTLVAYDHCNLGMSVSSASILVVGSNCTFRRLYAPEIFLGVDPESIPEGAFHPFEEIADARQTPVYRDDEASGNDRIQDDRGDPMEEVADAFTDHSETEHDSVFYVDERMTGESHVLIGTIISRDDVVVAENIVIKGNIRSHKSVTIMQNALVHGNVFAEHDIQVDQNARVYGNVLTQENLFLKKGASIGQYGKIKSAVARGEIVCEPGCRIYGYMSTERSGLCAPASHEEIADDSGRQAKIIVIPKASAFPEGTTFSDPDAFNELNPQVFRGNKHIETVVIPEGVTEIRASFFYECRNLKSVTLPSTLTEIGDFAFFGCVALDSVNLSDCIHLKKIGKSAFEGCCKLSGPFYFTALEEIGEAAFYDCLNLDHIYFSEDKALRTLPGHLFFGCVNLKYFSLPENLTEIGVSTFYGCASIDSLIIPHTTTTIGGFAFSGCTSLTKLEILSDTLEKNSQILTGINPNTKVLVKSEAVRKALR